MSSKLIDGQEIDIKGPPIHLASTQSRNTGWQSMSSIQFNDFVNSNWLVLSPSRQGRSRSVDDHVNVSRIGQVRSFLRLPKATDCEAVQSCSTMLGGCTRESISNICRICHEGRHKDENLIRVCMCAGSVMHVHHSCLLNWIAVRGDMKCELCQYEYKVVRAGVRRKRFDTWRYPSIGLKGCLHIMLFVAFLIMFLTSFIWVVWCQTSDSSAAIKERKSSEVKYAYLLNGVFMLTALAGMILDSCRHLKTYVKKVLALNQKIVVLEYFGRDDKITSLPLLWPMPQQHEGRKLDPLTREQERSLCQPQEIRLKGCESSV